MLTEIATIGHNGVNWSQPWEATVEQKFSIRTAQHGTLTLPVLLLLKFAGSTHFPVFFCQLWEKSFNILPATKTRATEGLWKAILGGKRTASGPSEAQRAIVSSVYVSKPRKKKGFLLPGLSQMGQILPDILQFVCLGGTV